MPRERDDYFDEDFLEGAVSSLRLSTTRIQWRAAAGVWPPGRIGATRKAMEDEIERLILAEVERRRLGEVTEAERTGPVIHYDRAGHPRMRPKS
jgi:hypothetical protein